MGKSRDDSTNEQMPPKLDPETKTKRFNIVAPESWLERLDNWRRVQPKVPNISEAIRVLVDRAIEAEKGKKKR